MPIITMDLWKGKTSVTQKQKVVKEITDTVNKILGCPKETVHIIINEHPKENWGVGGTLVSEISPAEYPC
ncbi:MAG: 4-oxalocrotonate tautomerase family protein [bacterium]|nr:4-oxalocrotonate tautomerase family protein [bacterium]